MLKLNHHDRVLLRLMQRNQRDKLCPIKIITLLMLNAGFSAAQIALALGINDATVYRYAQQLSGAKSAKEYLQLHYRSSDPL